MDSETARLARRQQLRERIAEAKLNAHEADVVRGQLLELQQQADAAAAVHQDTCRPIQERLAEVERLIKSALADRTTVDPALFAERAELLGQIQRANEVLQAEVNRVEQAKTPLLNQHKQLVANANWQNLTDDLGKMGIAKPEWLIERFCCDRAIFWGELRAKAAREQLELQEFELAQSKETRSQFLDEVQARVDRWRAEVRAASAAIMAASGRKNELFRMMINE